ncbi:MAG: YbjN domain-containing protein [Leptolyngbyaceae cyanobacterium MAG.088]|nr:YbjN domain-containing protein [Leptolyngbyaceae cyanobacterium MAG.088]
MSSLNVETVGETISAGTESFQASHVDVIETVIASLDQGGDAMVSQNDDGYLWKFTYGSVTVYVQLTGIDDEDTLTVWSPLLKLPVADQTALMQELLAMNCGETFEACYGISNQEVLILASRILADINPGEISRLMTIVATIADDMDDVLLQKYPTA